MIETDVIVIGSGVAGMTAAITARKLGLEVLLVEKTDLYGGTTAYSGGAPWIPCNHYMKTIGVTDSTDAARQYLRSVLGENYEPALVDAYVDAAPRMLEFMESQSLVRFKPFPIPDYEVAPGASRGRSLLSVEYDGRLLGDRLSELRQPLPQMMVFDTMQVEGTDVHPMRNVFRTWQGFRHTTRVVARFAADRLRHGRGTRIVNGNALAARLFHSCIQSGVTLWRRTAALELLRDGERVTGVVISKEGQRIETLARRGVLLATGGFGASEAMRREFIPFAEHHYSLQPEGNVGDGIHLGQAVGARHDPAHAGDCIWTPVSIMRGADGKMIRFPHISIDRSMPGCIAIGPDGRRFVNEGTSYQSFVITMHERGYTKAHLVCGRDFLRRYGLGLVRPFPFSERKYVENGYLLEAPTLAQLAGRMGIPAAELEATVTRFDAAAAHGEDVEFGKGDDPHSRFRGDQTHGPNPSIGPVGAGPFYAVAIHPGSLSTVGGLDTNEKAQVINGDKQPIPGLYAAGLDMNSMMRGRYPGAGSSIGPAMTFGFIAAHQMAASTAATAGAARTATA